VESSKYEGQSIKGKGRRKGIEANGDYADAKGKEAVVPALF